MGSRRIESDSGDFVVVSYEKRVHETDRAILFKFGADQEEWIPKSQLEGEDEDALAITIPRWLADQRGLL